MSSTMRSFGFFILAYVIMPRPSVPAPEMTTTSSLVMLPPVHCVLGAAVGLNEKGLLDAHILGNAADHAVLRVAHILSHAAVVVGLESQHVVGLAHPVMSVLAEPAFAAGNDLVRDDAVAQLVSFHVLTDLHHSSEELVAPG